MAGQYRQSHTAPWVRERRACIVRSRAKPAAHLVGVWVVLLCLLVEGLLHFLVAGGSADAEHIVVVFRTRGCVEEESFMTVWGSDG